MGAVCGAVGASASAVSALKAVGSVVVGVATAVYTGCNTEGDIWTKIATGVASGLVAGIGTYLGTSYPLAMDNAFSAGVTSYCNTLMTGVPTEMVNVAVQQGIKSVAQSNTNNGTVNHRTVYKPGFYSGSRIAATVM